MPFRALLCKSYYFVCYTFPRENYFQHLTPAFRLSIGATLKHTDHFGKGKSRSSSMLVDVKLEFAS